MARRLRLCLRSPDWRGAEWVMWQAGIVALQRGRTDSDGALTIGAPHRRFRLRLNYRPLAGSIMPLTNVQHFTEHGWEPITAEEAAEIYRYRDTISAGSHLFMCELCHQYVSFTREGERCRHFRHTPQDEKDCPERTHSVPSYAHSLRSEYSLPLRLVRTGPGFRMEIGLLPLPAEERHGLERVEIMPRNSGGRPLQQKPFSFLIAERLAEHHFSFVAVGEAPAARYDIRFVDANGQLREPQGLQFWPKEVNGVRGCGALFDAETGCVLPYDADVVVGRKYWLLAQHSGMWPMKHVYIGKLAEVGPWTLYEVIASAINKQSQQFFLNYHCRLTDSPIQLHLVWPPFVQQAGIICHERELLYFHRGGPDCDVHAHPLRRPEIRGRLIRMRSETRQVVSASRVYQLGAHEKYCRQIQQIYLWRVPSLEPACSPEVTVTDAAGTVYESGLHSELPARRFLVVQPECDGYVEVRQAGWVVARRTLKAGLRLDLRDLSYGTEVRVYQGLTCVFSVQFERKRTACEDDEQWAARLRRTGGPLVAVGHDFGAVASRLQDFPRVRSWVLACLRRREMPANAAKELRDFFIAVRSGG